MEGGFLRYLTETYGWDLDVPNPSVAEPPPSPTLVADKKRKYSALLSSPSPTSTSSVLLSPFWDNLSVERSQKWWWNTTTASVRVHPSFVSRSSLPWARNSWLSVRQTTAAEWRQPSLGTTSTAKSTADPIQIIRSRKYKLHP